MQTSLSPNLHIIYGNSITELSITSEGDATTCLCATGANPFAGQYSSRKEIPGAEARRQEKLETEEQMWKHVTALKKEHSVGAVQADCICIVYPGVSPVCVIEGGGGASPDPSLNAMRPRFSKIRFCEKGMI